MWKTYALAQDFMSPEAFAARKQLKQLQQTALDRQEAGQLAKEEEQALAELAVSNARREAVEHIQDTQAGLQQFLDEAADAIEVRFACLCGCADVLRACVYRASSELAD